MWKITLHFYYIILRIYIIFLKISVIQYENYLGQKEKTNRKNKGIQNEKSSGSGVWIWKHIFINVC